MRNKIVNKSDIADKSDNFWKLGRNRRMPTAHRVTFPKYSAGLMSIFGATDTLVLDFWFKARVGSLFCTLAEIHVIQVPEIHLQHDNLAGVYIRPAQQPVAFPHMRVSTEVGFEPQIYCLVVRSTNHWATVTGLSNFSYLLFITLFWSCRCCFAEPTEFWKVFLKMTLMMFPQVKISEANSLFKSLGNAS